MQKLLTIVLLSVLASACGGDDPLPPTATDADSVQQPTPEPAPTPVPAPPVPVPAPEPAPTTEPQISQLTCRNALEEKASDFVITASGQVLRDGEVTSDFTIHTTDISFYVYEYSWTSELVGGTKRYDYVKHGSGWLLDPNYPGERFIAIEHRFDTSGLPVLTYYEEGFTGVSITRCGASAMKDRAFLACFSEGPHPPPRLLKRKMARYDRAAGQLFIDDYVDAAAVVHDPVAGVVLANLADGWQRLEDSVTTPSAGGTGDQIIRRTIEFHPATGLIRSYLGKQSPFPARYSCETGPG